MVEEFATDCEQLNTHTPFSLYVAARIFARVLKAESENDDAKSSVRFLLSALLAIKDSNPLAESYLVQLDLEGVSLASLQENAGVADLGKSVVGSEHPHPVECDTYSRY